MGLMTDAAVVNIEGNTKQLVDQINKADKAMQNFDKTLTDILTHLSAVESGLKNVNGTTNNYTKNFKGNFFNAPTNSFVGARGTAANYTSTRSKGYQEAQNKYIQTQKKNLVLIDQQIEKEKELTRLKKEQANVVQQEANSRTRNSQAKLLRAQTANTAEMLSYYKGLGLKHNELQGFYQYKSAHPERFIAGALDWNPRYQGSKAIRGVGSAVSQFGTGGKLVGSLLDSLGTFVKSPIAGAAAAVTNLTNSVIDLGKSAVQSYSEIEAIKTQLGVVFSNQTQANSMFGQISEYAVHSPFGVQQTSELAVLLKQSGVYASDLMDTLKMLGDTAGGNMEKMKRIANNYAQIVSIGKASMLDMRQFAYAGIPIFEAVSKELGVSQQELRKLISDGKVTSDIVEKVFKDLTGINGIFENATEKGAKTLKARLQNLQDARQLAFGSLGEILTNTGTKTGGDSYANKIVTGIENIYSWLQEHVETKNIARDVQTIANREDRIAKLESLIEYNKVWGTPDVVEGLQKILEQEKAKRDPEKDRATWVEAYNNARGEFDKLFESGELIKLNELEIKIKEQEDKINKMRANAVGDVGTSYLYGTTTNGGLVLPGGAFLSAQKSAVQNDENINAAKEYLSYLENLRDAIKDSDKIQKEWIQAIREQTVIDSQQLAFDQANKNANTKDSLNYSFNELYEIWKASDEYKEQEEKERLERLTKAQGLLEEIVKNTDDLGNLKFGGMTRQEYQNFKNQGAFVGERKLDTVKDRTLLESQFAHNAGVVIDELLRSPAYGTVLGRNMTTALQGSFMKLAGATSDEDFSKQFAVTFSEMSKSLEEMAKYDSYNKDFYASLKEYLADATIQWNVRKEGLNANLNDLNKGGTTDMFIPLWKRILSSATGLTTNGMTSTKQTLTNYRDDMAIRNMTSDVLKATMKTMGVDAAMGLIRTNDAVQLKGDTGKTFQTDWIATKKAIKDFATQLSASTEVIVAYKNGLQAELDTYENLIAAGYTEAESADLGSQKYVSTKQLEKLALGNSSQLVNAFGEVLKTKSGREYNIADVTFGKNGELLDKLGNVIDEEVVVTGNLYEFIRGELPRLRQEIHEATVAELKNQSIEKMWQEASGTAYTSNLLGSQGINNTTKYLMNNPDFVAKTVASYLTKAKGDTVWNSETGRDELRYKYASRLDPQNILVQNEIAKTRIPELLQQQAELQRQLGKYVQYGGEGLATPNLIKSLEDRLTAVNSELDNLREVTNLTSSAFDEVTKEAEGVVKSNDYQNLDRLLTTKARDDAVNAALLKMYNIPSQTLSPENYEGVRGERNWFMKNVFGDNRAYDDIDLFANAIKDRIKFSDTDAFGNDKSIDLSERFREFQHQNSEGDWEWNEGVDFEKLAESLSETEKATLKWKENLEDVKNTMKDLGASALNISNTFNKGAFNKSFEAFGASLLKGDEAIKDLKTNYKALAAEMLQSVGIAMQEAGWNLVAMGAKESNKGYIAAGLALAAAGGAASGLGGALAESEKNKNKTDKETEKLENLKSDLQKLLEQARTDALYYENTLRHQTALGVNKGFSYKTVNDAVITPKGDVVTTDPKDYLIATKTPNQLVGGSNVTVQPVINCNVVNNTKAQVRQEQQTNADGSIDIITIIEEVAGGYIASSRSDEAFATRDIRLNGKQAIM